MGIWSGGNTSLISKNQRFKFFIASFPLIVAVGLLIALTFQNTSLLIEQAKVRKAAEVKINESNAPNSN